MASYSGSMLRFAAMMGVSTVVLMALPAGATESAAAARETTTAKPTIPVFKRHAARLIRTGRADHRRLSFNSSNPECAVWCGRQFVLMIGIAY